MTVEGKTVTKARWKGLLLSAINEHCNLECIDGVGNHTASCGWRAGVVERLNIVEGALIDHLFVNTN